MKKQASFVALKMTTSGPETITNAGKQVKRISLEYRRRTATATQQNSNSTSSSLKHTTKGIEKRA